VAWRRVLLVIETALRLPTRTLFPSRSPSRLGEEWKIVLWSELARDADVCEAAGNEGVRQRFVMKHIHLPVKITDAKGNVTEITRDAKGNTTTIKNAKGEEIVLEYNARGQVTKITDALSHPTTLGYDSLGRLTSVTDALNQSVTQILDAAGNVTAVTDALNRTTGSTFDVMNQRLTTTGANMGVIRFDCDDLGNVTGITDQKLQKTTFVLDTLDRVIEAINALGQKEISEYNLEDNLTGFTTRNWVVIVYQYNERNELIGKTVPGVGDFSFVVDEVGNLTEARSPDSVINNVFDLANRLTSTSTTGSPFQPAVTISYILDKNGNRERMDDPSGTTTHEVDKLDRLGSIVVPLYELLGMLPNSKPIG